MMSKKNIIIIFTFLFSIIDFIHSEKAPEISVTEKSTQIKDDRFEVSINYNPENNNTQPFFKWTWFHNNAWFSGLEAAYLTKQTSEKVDGFSESRLATVYEEINFKFNILSGRLFWGDFYPYLGFGVEYRNLNRTEFGYIHLPANLGNYWVSFENKSDINAFLFPFTLSINYLSSNIDTYTKIDFSPKYHTQVKQDTFFKPIIAENGTTSSRQWQGPGFTISQEFYFKTDLPIDFFIYGEYSLLRFKYDLKTLGVENNSFVFTDSKIDSRFSNYRIAVNFVLKELDLFGNLKPFLGIGYNWEKAEELISLEKEITEEVFYNFGFKFRERV